MNKEVLVEKAYAVFSSFEKPVHCTKNHALEGAEFNVALQSVARKNLTIDQVGTVAWGPLPSMTPEAMAFFMPRLIELAVTGVINGDGEHYYCHFINAFYEYADDGKYTFFARNQKKVMASTFIFLYQNYHEQLKIDGWLEEVQQAIGNWENA